jgi:hypothetical protein
VCFTMFNLLISVILLFFIFFGEGGINYMSGGARFLNTGLELININNLILRYIYIYIRINIFKVINHCT